MARWISSSTAREVGQQGVDVEADLADRHVDVAVAVGAVLDLAALELLDGLADVGGDGAGLGVGHQATGAEHPAELADERHEVGRGDGDVEVEHARPRPAAARSSPPTWSAPAARAAAAASPLANTATRTSLPVPDGRATVPRTIWSALRGSTPSRMASSTTRRSWRCQPLHEVERLDRGEQLVAVEPLRRVGVLLALRHAGSWLPRWSSAGRARSLPRSSTCWLVLRLSLTSMPIDRAVPATWSLAASRSLALRSGILIWAISVDLGVGDRADGLAAGVRGGLVEPGGLADQHRRGRGLEDERERAVLEDGDLDGDDRAPLGLGGGVVGLAEVHDRHAVGAEGGADGRRGRGLTGRDLDLDDGQDLLLGHEADSLRDGAGRPDGRSEQSATAWRPGRTRARPASPGRRC